MKNILFTSMSLALPLCSFAQTTPSTFTLESALQQSKDDHAKVSALLDAESSKGAGFDICHADVLSLQKSYDQWFQTNYSSFVDLRKTVLDSIESANRKLKQLQTMSVYVVPVKGQSGEVGITLSSLIAYFSNLNDRLSTCSEKDLKLLLESQENPNLNPLKISHTQALVAMDMMTQNLNASLRDEGADFTFGFIASKRHFDISFEMQMRVASKEVKYTVPLLETNSFEIVSTEEEIWSRLGLQQVTIGGYSVDARARYRQFRDQNMQKQCVESKKVAFPGAMIGLPFANFEDAAAQVSFGQNPLWSELDFNLGKASQVLISNSSVIYVLVTEGKSSTVYSRSLSSPQWTQVTQGAIKSMALDQDGGLYGLGFSGRIYHKDAKENQWNFHSGTGGLQNLSVSNQDEVHFLVGGKNLGSSNTASESYTTSSPKNIASFIALTRNYFVLDVSGEIFMSPLGKPWAPVAITPPPAKAIQLAGINDQELMALCEDGNVYTYSDGFWFVAADAQDHKLSSIYVNHNHEIVGVDASGKIYVLKEKK